MNAPIHMFFKRFLPSLLVMALSGLFLAPACEDKEAELERHRPRRDRPLLQVLPPEPKPLLGLFVDVNSKAAAPDGKSWDTAFKTIQDGINASKGQDIYVAAGTYNSPNLNLRDRVNIRLVGGYKAGEKFEKDRTSLKADEWVVLDGQGLAAPLVVISGNAERISFAGGFEFKNALGASAVTIHGIAANAPVKEISIINSKFNNNNNNAIAGNGGGIDATYVKDLRLDNLVAENNQATNLGGFLRITDVDGLSLIGGAWKTNSAENGGALYLARASHVSFFGQTVEANRATLGAGVFVRELQNQVIKDIQFVSNQGVVVAGVNRGAGIHIELCQDSSLLNLSLRGNQLVTGAGLDSTGGGLFMAQSSNMILDFAQAHISGNRSKVGGAIAIDKKGSSSSAITIKNGQFSDNEALQLGGGIYAYRTSDMKIIGANFLRHKAQSGAAVYFHRPGKQTVVDRVIFEQGEATANAGGLMVFGRHPTPANIPTILVKNSIFSNNKSVGNGGAFMAKNTSYPVTIEHTMFRSNKTDNFGGALALDARSLATAKFILGRDTKFFNNRAERGAGGGAIYAVFNPAAADVMVDIFAGNPPALGDARRLVFFNTITDHRDNITGQVSIPAVVLNTAGLFGNFMRVGNAAVDDITPPDRNGGARVFLSPARPQIPRLERFISYSINPADNIRPWNQLGLNWETSEIDVYAW